MKFRLLLLLALISGACTVWGQNWTVGAVPTAQDGSEYYIYNIESGMFLNHGSAWGTHLTVDGKGECVSLWNVEGGYHLHMSSFASQVDFAANGYANCDNEAEDATAHVATYVLEAVSVGGYANAYKIKLKDKTDGLYWLKNDNGSYLAYGNEVWLGDVTDNTRGTWLFIPKATREDISSATVNNPKDATHLLKNPDMEAWDGGLTDWTGDMTLQSSEQDLFDGRFMECWCGEHNTAKGTLISEGKYKLNNVSMTQSLSSVPNGLYRLSVNGSAEQQVGGDKPVGVTLFANNNSSEITYKTGTYSVLVNVTDGNLNLGVKVENTNVNWVKFDKFRLAYLGNIDNQSSAGADFSGLLGKNFTDWKGEQGNGPSVLQGGAETYKDNGAYTTGDVLTQTVTNLVPGKYIIQFYAVANSANNVTFEEGIGYAQAFANDAAIDVEGIKQSACTLESNDYLRTITATVGDNGILKFGLKNVANGGNWYVAQAKSLTYLGNAFATMAIPAGKYGTFCAPFDVTLPEGVVAYEANMNDAKTSVSLTEATLTDNVLPAGTAVIVNTTNPEGLAATTFYGKATQEGETCTTGSLVGILTEAGKLIPVGAYIMQIKNDVQSFYRVAKEGNGVLNRCYLVTGSDARILTIDGDETGISNIEEEMTSDNAVYDLSGRRVQKAQKGIYIVNGKKVIR